MNWPGQIVRNILLSIPAFTDVHISGAGYGPSWVDKDRMVAGGCDRRMLVVEQ